MKLSKDQRAMLRIIRYLAANMHQLPEPDAFEIAQLLRHMPAATLRNLVIKLGLAKPQQARKLDRNKAIHLVSDNCCLSDIQEALLPN